jgi:polyhydroxybutyrate depolymerase
VAFFDAMLGWLDDRTCIDRRRVFAMRYSNGAAFAGVLACARVSSLAGVALASGRWVCQPAGAMPAIIGHGTRDQTASYDQALQTGQTWSTVNGCSAPPASGTAGCFAAASSYSSAPTTLCTHQGGHEYYSAFTQSFADFFQRVGSRK